MLHNADKWFKFDTNRICKTWLKSAKQIDINSDGSLVGGKWGGKKP